MDAERFLRINRLKEDIEISRLFGEAVGIQREVEPRREKKAPEPLSLLPPPSPELDKPVDVTHILYLAHQPNFHLRNKGLVPYKIESKPLSTLQSPDQE